MRNMTATHWAILAGFLATWSVQIAGLESWADATTPAFVGGALGQLALAITAIFTNKPRPTDAQTRTGDRVPLR